MVFFSLNHTITLGHVLLHYIISKYFIICNTLCAIFVFNCFEFKVTHGYLSDICVNDVGTHFQLNIYTSMHNFIFVR